MMDQEDVERIEWEQEKKENKIIINQKSKKIGFSYLIDDNLFELKNLKDSLWKF